MGTDKIKKVVIWLVVAFIAYAIFKSPEKAANIFTSIGALLKDGVTSLGRFFDDILNH